MTKNVCVTYDKEDAIFALGQGIPAVFYLSACCPSTKFGGHQGDFRRIYGLANRSSSKVLVTSDCGKSLTVQDDFDKTKRSLIRTDVDGYTLENGLFVPISSYFLVFEEDPAWGSLEEGRSRAHNDLVDRTFGKAKNVASARELADVLDEYKSAIWPVYIERAGLAGYQKLVDTLRNEC